MNSGVVLTKLYLPAIVQNTSILLFGNCSWVLLFYYWNISLHDFLEQDNFKQLLDDGEKIGLHESFRCNWEDWKIMRKIPNNCNHCLLWTNP